MRKPMNETNPSQESNTHVGTDSASVCGNRLGFRPAFLDFATLAIYPSRFADGRPAPFHLLDGLPDEVVKLRVDARVISAKSTIIAGFERGGFFYTRTAAARACEQWDLDSPRV
jgi:hypothetical protein